MSEHGSESEGPPEQPTGGEGGDEYGPEDQAPAPPADGDDLSEAAPSADDVPDAVDAPDAPDPEAAAEDADDAAPPPPEDLAEPSEPDDAAPPPPEEQAEPSEPDDAAPPPPEDLAEPSEPDDAAPPVPGPPGAYDSAYGPNSVLAPESRPDTPAGGSIPEDQQVPAGDAPQDLPHVEQREPNWCGAACGEMVAGRLGVDVSQDQLVETEHFEQAFSVRDQVIRHGGFHAIQLGRAMEEVAPVDGRTWVGGQFAPDISTPDNLRETMNGYLDATESSIMLRVHGGNHWVVVDGVRPDGLIAIRDPGAQGPALVTAEQLHAMHPVSEAVFSFRDDREPQGRRR